ncbi:MAG: hypothetical protein A2840_02740 [Candidatus Buchananbacteria bacterium RIFCSPHIGHO2_01_FULL_47_11b]|uniref:Glycosyltransferase 2-like domain-containing protein n=1 Tax=Candidatus Buchananbacteria bacterium RIFCSPHIGHO2_01_FULL_47_11b TaxID=1797537 RepID=A0A1G1Y3H7_9BACT|nr:MAG: hypothetical protein A2840_02740 [Candidatus Buchananbacteria bacterium RIFCSPHIGHO2_01_FULL_47_11b]
MKISCVIPTCNRNDLLAEAIRSVLQQTRKPNEIIVVNNGSEDVVLPADMSGQVTVLTMMPFVGVAQARNFGAMNASGEFVAFLDDDDLWSKNYLENVEAAINRGAQIIISRLDKYVAGQISAFKQAHGKITLDRLLVYNPGITGSNTVIARELFFSLGGYDPKLPPSEDKSLILEAVRQNIAITTLPDNVSFVRFHNAGRLTNDAKMAEGIYQFVRKYGSIMNWYQRLLNWLKVYQHRYRSGKRLSFIPFVFCYIIFRLAKPWQRS